MTSTNVRSSMMKGNVGQRVVPTTRRWALPNQYSPSGSVGSTSPTMVASTGSTSSRQKGWRSKVSPGPTPRSRAAVALIQTSTLGRWEVSVVGGEPAAGPPATSVTCSPTSEKKRKWARARRSSS